MTEQDKIVRGNRAQELLGDSLLKEAFGTIEKDATEKLLAAAPLDDALRRACADRINAIRAVRDELKSVLTTGRLASLRKPPTDNGA